MTIRVTERQLIAYNHFVSAGLHEEGAAAPVGNFVQESGEDLDSSMFRAHPDASGGVAEELKSGGIAEWLGDRKTAYIVFSQATEARRGLPRDSLLNDLETQCDYCVLELRTGAGYAALYEQLTTETIGADGNPRSVATLTANFMEIYERPKKGPTAKLENRIAHAEAVYSRAQLFKGAQTVPQAPVPSTPAHIPTAPPQPHPTPVPMPQAPWHPPISASTAGRQAAVRDMLEALRANYIAELKSLKDEISVIDTTIADFEKLTPVDMSASLHLPKPALRTTIPPIISTTTTGINTMLGKSWITSVFGVGSIAGAIATLAVDLVNKDTAHLGSDIGLILGSLSGGVGLLNAKDKNVTGGTISAVTGTELMAPVSLVDTQSSLAAHLRHPQ